MNQPANDLQQFQDLEGQAAGAQEQAAASTQQTAQTLSTMQPPQRNTGIFSQAPLLIALTALGGKAIGLHARTMLGATNGMVKGMLMGNQQAFDDATKQYEENRQKLLDTWKLQQSYFDTLSKAYSERADAKLKAIQAARQLTNDEWQHEYKDQLAAMKNGMNEETAYLKQQELIHKIEQDNVMDSVRRMNADTARMKADIQKQQFDQKLQGTSSLKDIDGMIKDLNTQARAIQAKTGGLRQLNPDEEQQYNDLLTRMGQLNVRRQELMEQGRQTGIERPSVGTGVDPATGAPSGSQSAKSGVIDRGQGVSEPPAPASSPKSTPTFASEADAQKAAASGQIKPGDKIVIGGVSGTWQ
jgi:hypothetical protein